MLYRGLELANYGAGEDNVEVDIMVGSDQYWSHMSGRVIGGSMAPLLLKPNLDGCCQVQFQREYKLTGTKVISSQHIF